MDLIVAARPGTVVEMYPTTDIIKTLPSLIENTISGKTPGLSHRMLFVAESHGLGKTTLARCVASDANPAIDDMTRRDILNGVDTHVVKFINGATYRGLDDARTLEKDIAEHRSVLNNAINYFYVIDEIHRVTPAAISGMLQPLEDVPENVFVIATTTDIEKLLTSDAGKEYRDGEAFLSRFQVFNFHPLDKPTTARLLMDTAKKHGFTTLTQPIAEQIYEMTKGVPRDAVKIMDRYLSHGILDIVQEENRAEASARDLVDLYLYAAADPKMASWYQKVVPVLTGFLNTAESGPNARTLIINTVSRYMLHGNDIYTHRVVDNHGQECIGKCIRALGILFEELEPLLVYPLKYVLVGRLQRAYDRVRAL